MASPGRWAFVCNRAGPPLRSARECWAILRSWAATRDAGANLPSAFVA